MNDEEFRSKVIARVRARERQRDPGLLHLRWDAPGVVFTQDYRNDRLMVAELLPHRTDYTPLTLELIEVLMKHPNVSTCRLVHLTKRRSRALMVVRALKRLERIGVAERITEAVTTDMTGDKLHLAVELMWFDHWWIRDWTRATYILNGQ